MRYFPIFMDLQDQPVLVVGGGSVAERKVRLLLRAGARVRLVAQALGPALSRRWRDGEFEWLGRDYRHHHLDSARLAFAASDDVSLNRQVHADAEARGVPVNVVDDRRHCRFISPAVVDRSPLQIAVSSGGASPVLARRIRSWIERLLPEGLGKVAEAAERVRAAASNALPLAARRRFWDRVLDAADVHAWSRRDVASIEACMRRALESADAHNTGRVYLVGAGPGRSDLLTLRALQVMGQADVILHDRLVSAEILDLARRDAEFIDVGKRAGCHRRSQEQINHLLLDHARRGRQVVRLKGGDGFIYGRGGEELEYLRSHGVDYEVVPGITAAIGCAAFAGIPLTHREYAQSVSFVTGHVSDGGTPPDWTRLAGGEHTVVVYMGLRQSARLRRQLLRAGIDPRLPAALVADGTRDGQEVIQGTVDTLPAMAARAAPGAPTLFIIGRVAALGERLAWFAAHAGERAAA